MLGVNLSMNFSIYDIIHTVKSAGITDAAYITPWIGTPINDIGSPLDTHAEKFGCKNTPTTITAIDVLTLNFLAAFIASIIGIK